MSRMDVEAYLERIRYRGPRRVDAQTLAALQRTHLLAVPFDSLDCHLGQPVTVAPEDAYRKVVDHVRGGFCFELNGLFGWLLQQLGFPVTSLGARVHLGGGQLSPPNSHQALLVELERRWLVDVGFGHVFALEPLDLDVRGEQHRDGRRYRIRPEADALVAEELGSTGPGSDGGPRAYQFSLSPARRTSLADQCRFYAGDPESPFVRFAPVMQQFPDGWVSVTRERVSGVRGGTTLDWEVDDEAHWRSELRRHFGLVVQDRQVRGA